MDDERALTVLAQVAEQMGFLTPLGPAEAAPGGPDALVVRVAFTGPSSGVVAVAASRGLAEALARNLLALDPAAAVSPADALDALAELANVSTGNLLPLLHGDGEYRLTAPAAGPWPGSLAQSACLECAEGILALAVESASGGPMRVLIADDDRLFREVLTHCLSAWGYAPEPCNDGAGAWAVLSAEDAPRLAILDWEMPGPGGLELCHRVHALARPAPTYCILLSAHTEPEKISAGLSAGAHDFIVKPMHHLILRRRLALWRRLIEGEQTAGLSPLALEGP